MWLGTLILAAGLAQAGEPARVLYYHVGSSHESSKLAGELLAKLGKKESSFTLEECDDFHKWSDAYFKPYAAIVFFSAASPELTDAHKQALLGFVRRGGGFVGVHSASQFCRGGKWPEYNELLRATFVGSLGVQSPRVTTEDRRHPATRHLEPWFALADDYYRFTNWSRKRTHVLLSLDVRSLPDGKRFVGGVEADHGVSWCHRYGEGRVFYTTLGHGERLWRDERFLQHVFNATRWAAGVASGKAPLGTDYRIHHVRRSEPTPRSVATSSP